MFDHKSAHNKAHHDKQRQFQILFASFCGLELHDEVQLIECCQLNQKTAQRKINEEKKRRGKGEMSFMCEEKERERGGRGC